MWKDQSTWLRAHCEHKTIESCSPDSFEMRFDTTENFWIRDVEIFYGKMKDVTKYRNTRFNDLRLVSKTKLN